MNSTKAALSLGCAVVALAALSRPAAAADTVAAYEAPEWNLGNAHGQNGWTCNPNTTAWANIDTANPHSGSQHVRIQYDPIGTGFYWLDTPLEVLPAFTPARTSLWFNISTSAHAHRFTGWQLGVGGNYNAWTVNLIGTHIYVYEGQWVDTGAIWTTGVYNQLVVEYDPHGSVKYYLNGTLFRTGPPGAGSSRVSMVRFEMGNVAGAWTADIDDFSHVVGAPADVNCDGIVDFFDIDPFMMALFTPAAYATAYPNCLISNGDINRDGIIDFFDIDSFLDVLFGG